MLRPVFNNDYRMIHSYKLLDVADIQLYPSNGVILIKTHTFDLTIKIPQGYDGKKC